MDFARVLVSAAARIRLLGATVPEGALAERARLVAEAEAGRDPVPRWTYRRHDLSELAVDVDTVADALEAEAQLRNDALLLLYAARARELAMEARLVSCVGQRSFGPRARRRFQVAPSDERCAEAIALTWSKLAVDDAGPTFSSSGPEPHTLVSQMRRALGEARVPFTVTVSPELTALAATGEREVYVAADRPVTLEDVTRTVAHEIQGHVLPRVRAASMGPKIFQLGTARGADDQEGYALVIEERMGLLTPRRRRGLALRHLAAARMDDGATFVETVRHLVAEHGATRREAVTTAERAYRGGDGERAGLGRERVYIATFEAVRAHLAEMPGDEDVLKSGQIALEAVPDVRPLVQ